MTQTRMDWYTIGVALFAAIGTFLFVRYDSKMVLNTCFFADEDFSIGV